MPFTLRNIKEDLEDIGPRFDGAPGLEFRAATKALDLARRVIAFRTATLTRPKKRSTSSCAGAGG